MPISKVIQQLVYLSFMSVFEENYVWITLKAYFKVILCNTARIGYGTSLATGIAGCTVEIHVIGPFFEARQSYSTTPKLKVNWYILNIKE